MKWSVVLTHGETKHQYCGEFDLPTLSDEDSAYRMMIADAAQAINAKTTGGLAYYVYPKAKLLEAMFIQ